MCTASRSVDPNGVGSWDWRSGNAPRNHKETQICNNKYSQVMYRRLFKMRPGSITIVRSRPLSVRKMCTCHPRRRWNPTVRKSPSASNSSSPISAAFFAYIVLRFEGEK